MEYNFRQGGDWNQGVPKKRRNGEWVAINGTIDDDDGTNGNGTGDLDGGFDWDQTFTDTSWLHNADSNDNLNVEVVTNLDASGSGSLINAVDNADSYPTVVVFEVGGVIDLDGDAWRNNDDVSGVWIAGETAPWPGISLIKGRIRNRIDNCIMTHIGVYPGDDTNEAHTAIQNRGDNLLVDHCTTALSSSTNFSTGYDTLRNSCINTIHAEGLFDTDLTDDFRSRGFLVLGEETEKLVQLGCLYAHHNKRHPLVRGEMLMANNHIYNYTDKNSEYSGSGAGGNIISCSGGPEVTAKGLLFEEGAGTPDDYDREIFSHSGEVYAEDIERPDRHPLVDGPTLVDDPMTIPPGLDFENDILPTSKVKDYVQANVGPRPAERPPYEKKLISNRLEEPHDLIDSQTEIGGYPDYDQTSHDLDVPSTDIVDWVKGYTEEVELGT